MTIHYRTREAIKFLLFLAMAACLLWFAFRGMDMRAIISGVFKAKFFWALLSFCCSAIAMVSRAYRWNILLEPLGYRPSLRKTFYAVAIGYLANFAFPRLGEVSRCASLSKSDAIPFNVLLGTVVLERLIDVLCLILCLLWVMVLEFKRLGHFLGDSILRPVLQKIHALGNSPLLIWGLALIMIAGIVAVVLFRKNKKEKTGRISKLIKGTLQGISTIRQLKRPAAFIVHTVLIWMLYYLSVYVALFAFPSTQNLGLSAALFLLVAGGFAMSAPVQGGIGAYHLLVSQGLMLYGVSQTSGLTFATFLHSLQIVLVVCFGSLSLIMVVLTRKSLAQGRENAH